MKALFHVFSPAVGYRAPKLRYTLVGAQGNQRLLLFTYGLGQNTDVHISTADKISTHLGYLISVFQFI